MIVRWPGRVKSGVVIETPVHAVDILPTALEAAGGEAPEGVILDGESLLTRLTSDGRDPRLAERPIYQYYPFYDLRWGMTPSATIRQGDYKLIEFFGDRVDAQGRYQIGHRLELYNLRADDGETAVGRFPVGCVRLHRRIGLAPVHGQEERKLVR